jgi:tetratricopeptide (TPR) repeat protein
MKFTSGTIITILALGGFGGTMFYLGHKAATPAPVIMPLAQSTSEQADPPVAQKISAPETAAPGPAVVADAQAQATSTVEDMPQNDSANPIHKAVDGLLAATSGKEKHELFQQLVKSGQIDAAIAELKRRAADDPDNAQIPTTLGEAILNKVRDMHDSGKGDYNEIAILAMQADQSFNNALKIDPQNWEANYVKASSMYYWPADPARDADAAQRLSNLIDQQEKATTQQPEFVQTYLALGNQYMKLNQPDKAQATWQLGLQKFPSDPMLLKKINGQ